MSPGISRSWISHPSLMLLAAAVLLASCLEAPSPSPTPTSPLVADEAPDWRTDPSEPYPFTTPLPAYAFTAIDGTYTRQPTDPYTGDRTPCTRCPPYPLDRGSSELRLDRGRYQVLHSEPHYRGVGHYEIDGSLLILFNDPECADGRGIYSWFLSDDTLSLEAIDDDCAFGQRAADLGALPWSLVEAPEGARCQPPNEEAAITGHWPAPPGC
jgi:hypothetical protein